MARAEAPLPLQRGPVIHSERRGINRTAILAGTAVLIGAAAFGAYEVSQGSNNGSKPDATANPGAIVEPSNSPIPTQVNPTESIVIPTATPEVTPVPTAIPEATPNIPKINSGKDFIAEYNTWKKSHSTTINYNSLLAGAKAFLEANPSLNLSSDTLTGEHKDLTTSRDIGDFTAGCDIIIPAFAQMNNQGVKGSLDIAFKYQAVCETRAKKLGLPIKNAPDGQDLYTNELRSLDNVLAQS